MILEICPHCNNYLSFSMDYNYGNPVIVYTCDDCKYMTFGEAYIADNKTTITICNSATTNSTTTIYEPTGIVKKNNGMTTFTVR